MSWLIFMFAVEAGLLSGVEALDYEFFEYPEQSTYITLEIEGQAGPFFAGGSIESHQQFAGTGIGILPSFNPYRSIFGFNAGLRWEIFEIGWRHMCDHPVISSIPQSPASGGYDRFYLRVEVTR